MAVALEIGVSDLLPEFLAHAFVFLGALQTAGAVSTGPFQTLLNGGNDFLIFIQMNSHIHTSFLFYYINVVKAESSKWGV